MDKLRAMWAVLMGRAVVYGVKLKSAETGDEGAAAIKGPWVALSAVRGGVVTFGGCSEIG